MGLLKQSLRNGKGYYKIICETYKLWPGLLLRPFLFSNLDNFLAFTPGKAFFVYFFRKATCAENLHYEQAPLPEISFVRGNPLSTGGNVIRSGFVRPNRLLTGCNDISVVEVAKIWTNGKRSRW